MKTESAAERDKWQRLFPKWVTSFKSCWLILVGYFNRRGKRKGKKGLEERGREKKHKDGEQRETICSQTVAATSSWERNESSVHGDPVSPECITTADLPLHVSKCSAIPATSSCHLQTLEAYNKTSVL
ncbi:uncharacterized protein [Symphalangus syndactylus]|uniref:uncharacterized protein n=1 Tax=Symphalangus syndactylus TaxID=9590 RepID=UPI00300503BE